MLCTYYLSLATIMCNNPLWQRKCECSVVSRVNVSAAMVTFWIVICCCASEHMIFWSENKCFHNVSARLYIVDLPSIFKEPACEKPNLLGAGNFSDYLPFTAMALSYTQSGKKTNLWEISFRLFLRRGRRAFSWHIFPLQE